MANPIKSIFVILVAFGFVACTQSEFGSSGKKAKPPTKAQPPQTPPLDSNANGETDPDSDADGDAVPGLEKFWGKSSKSYGKVDIVFAVDTSGSMNDEKTKLQENMASFIDKFTDDNAKIDYQIFMIGDDFNFSGLSEPNITHVQQKISSHDALEILQDFLAGELTADLSLREEASTQFVVVSDDDATQVTAPDFRAYLDSDPRFKDKASFHGFVFLPTSVENDWCTRANFGDEYIALGADDVYGGLVADLCTEDWDELVKNLADVIITEDTKKSFKLREPADPDESITIHINGFEVEKEFWSYDEGEYTITFVEEKAPESEDLIKIKYTPL